MYIISDLIITDPLSKLLMSARMFCIVWYQNCKLQIDHFIGICYSIIYKKNQLSDVVTIGFPLALGILNGHIAI